MYRSRIFHIHSNRFDVGVDNKPIDWFWSSPLIHKSKLVSPWALRLLNKFQSFILIRRPPFWIPGSFVLFYNCFIFVVYFAWINLLWLWLLVLASMTGYEIETFPIYLLHCCILCRSAANRWINQILCPSYRINSSKREDVRCNGIFCLEKCRSSTKNQP